MLIEYQTLFDLVAGLLNNPVFSQLQSIFFELRFCLLLGKTRQIRHTNFFLSLAYCKFNRSNSRVEV
ncbi:hypothetical protein D3C72_1046590 [compost metagenome]